MNVEIRNFGSITSEQVRMFVDLIKKLMELGETVENVTIRFD